MSDAKARVLAGRYRLAERLGSGGMGTVWRARDELLGREVAIKELVPPPDLDDDVRAALNERAVREARAASRVRHPGIIGIHDVVSEDGRPWIVMEVLTGRTVEDTIRERGPLPPARAAGIGLRVLEALCAAHAQGILHRDVKPSNVFLCDDGRVVLTDFGIATMAGDPSLTRSGALVGSPGYIAPERLRGRPPAGPGSDLWSLGATLYAAVEGRGPFARRTPLGTLSAVLTEEPAPPHRAGALAQAIVALLAKDPRARPTAAAAELHLRHAAGAAGPVPTEVPGMPAPAPHPAAASPAAAHHAAASPAAVSPPVTSPAGAAGGARAGRRIALRWLAAVPAVVACVAGLLVWAYAARSGDSGDENPTGGGSALRSPAPAAADPVTGSFRTPPRPCDLLEARTAGGRAQPEGQDACRWQVLNAPAPTVRVLHFRPSGTTTAPALAQAYFADKKRQESKPSGDTNIVTRAPVRDVPGVGDESFAVDAEKVGTPESTVWLRVSNVVVEVTYETVAGGEDRSRLAQNAERAARAAAAKLRN